MAVLTTTDEALQRADSPESKQRVLACKILIELLSSVSTDLRFPYLVLTTRLDTSLRLLCDGR